MDGPTEIGTVVVGMPLWAYALWGAAGGLVVEGLLLWQFLRSSGGVIPEQFRRGYRIAAFLLGEGFRLGSGAILATAFAQSGQIHGALPALTIGIAAPLFVEKILRGVESGVQAQIALPAMQDGQLNVASIDGTDSRLRDSAAAGSRPA